MMNERNMGELAKIGGLSELKLAVTLDVRSGNVLVSKQSQLVCVILN